MRNFTVTVMAALRFLSGIIEICAALLILYYNKPETALRINGILAIVGPALLLLGIITGAAGLSGRLPLARLLMIYLGALLIFFGTRQP